MTEENSARAPSLVDRRADILQSLAKIRSQKTALLGTLQALSADGDPDKALVAKLVSAYDGLEEQENVYSSLLRQILSTLESNTREVEELLADKAVSESVEDDVDCDDKDVLELLAERARLCKDATDALDRNKALLATINRNGIEKSAKQYEAKKNESDRRDEATKLLEALELTKLRVSSQRSGCERREKQLARLRAQAAKRKIVLDSAAADAIPGDDDHRQQCEDERLRLEEEEREAEEKERQLQEQSQQHAGGTITGQIRERLDAIERRRQRMHNLKRAMALKSAGEVNDAYESAVSNLEYLTELRQYLESMRETGEQQQSTSNEQHQSNGANPASEEAEDSTQH